MALNRRNITIIDGYNVINAWPNLSDISKSSLESAREKLIDELAEYKSMSGEEIIIVFDAYNLDRPKETISEKFGMKIVYTKRFQTADTYIEKQILKISQKHNLKVVTDDGQIQILASNKGAVRMTSTELKSEIYNNRRKINRRKKQDFNRNFDSFPLSKEMIEKIDQIKNNLDKK
ncbi:NYN domain-containing protein [Anaerococcus sp. DFU013_CI05]|uniref:YacP-like NYN domain-containing protein n=1 Tax=unclassified Anaerococcus TaxID=2614126 RepID=UPI0019339642|nr:NYN domain-containing protein [Anaerococcus sp. mt242]MBM0046833.1 NYN domain-containing protein [Anaerococcus sp. mt242]